MHLIALIEKKLGQVGAILVIIIIYCKVTKKIAIAPLRYPAFSYGSLTRLKIGTQAQGKFHIVDNDKKLSETLRCSDAGLQPAMGQKLRIAYCYETDKHGRCHFLTVDVKTYSD